MRALMAVVLVSAVCAMPVWAQETPTEREAAKEVLQKMDALERALDVPSLVARLSATSARRDAIAARAKALLETELLALSDDICTHPLVKNKVRVLDRQHAVRRQGDRDMARTIAWDVLQAIEAGSFYRNPSWACDGCPFRKQCGV